MGDMFPDNYAAKAAYAAYSESIQLLDEDNNPMGWEDLLDEDRDVWIAVAKAAYKAEKHLLSDQ